MNVWYFKTSGHSSHNLFCINIKNNISLRFSLSTSFRMTSPFSYLYVFTTFMLISSIISQQNQITFPRSSKNVWWETGKKLGSFIQHCFHVSPKSSTPSSDTFHVLQECFKKRAMKAIDRAIDMDVIEIYDGMKFVKQEWSNLTEGNAK